MLTTVVSRPFDSSESNTRVRLNVYQKKPTLQHIMNMGWHECWRNSSRNSHKMQTTFILAFHFKSKWVSSSSPNLIHIVWKLLKMSHLTSSTIVFSTNFCPIKMTSLVTLFFPQALSFQKLAKIDHFGIFNQLLSTQNVNVARFARNIKWYFSVIFNPI